MVLNGLRYHVVVEGLLDVAQVLVVLRSVVDHTVQHVPAAGEIHLERVVVPGVVSLFIFFFKSRSLRVRNHVQ